MISLEAPRWRRPFSSKVGGTNVMSAFSFRAEFDSNRSVELVPTHIHPLGVPAIRALEASECAPVELELESDGALIDGEKKAGRTRVKAQVVFNKQTSIFALTRGGWLPMPFAIPPRFLVDRNVVISLRRIREGKTVMNADSLMWWTQFFSQGTALFNPLPYAFEAGFRRKPTMEEFVAAYDDGATELASALPACQIVRFADTNYRAAYVQLEAFDSRTEREVAFLQLVCPLVTQRTNQLKQWSVATEIASIADNRGVNRASLACLATMSCVFEAVNGTPPAIGRQVLKPKATYSEADAFNALSDLRHIEIAAAGQAHFKEKAFSLATCDRPLALLWSALAMRGEFTTSTSMEVTFDLTGDLFARLHEADLHRLKELLRA